MDVCIRCTARDVLWCCELCECVSKVLYCPSAVFVVRCFCLFNAKFFVCQCTISPLPPIYFAHSPSHLSSSFASTHTHFLSYRLFCRITQSICTCINIYILLSGILLAVLEDAHELTQCALDLSRENWMFIWMPFVWACVCVWVCLRVNVWFFRFIFPLVYCDCFSFSLFVPNAASLRSLAVCSLCPSLMSIMYALSCCVLVCSFTIDINCCAFYRAHSSSITFYAHVPCFTVLYHRSRKCTCIFNCLADPYTFISFAQAFKFYIYPMFHSISWIWSNERSKAVLLSKR